jgi:WD40 repeat protein
LFFFNHLALHPTSSPEYIRQIQQRLFLQPLSRLLQNRHGQQTIAYLKSLIPQIKQQRGYAAGNLINLAIELQANFADWDLTGLYIAEVDFQEALLPKSDFPDTEFDRCRFAQEMGTMFDLAFSPNGQMLAAGGTDGQVHLWEVATGRKLFQLQGHDGWVRTLCFSKDNRYLASGSGDHTIRVWDTTTGECLHILTGHQDIVWLVYFSPNSSIIFSIDRLREIKVWWLKRSQALLSIPVPDPNVWGGNIDMSKGRIVVLSPQGVVVRSLWSGKQQFMDLPATKKVNKTAISPDKKYLWGASFTAEVYCWDIETGELIHTLTSHSRKVSSIAFTPDGQRMVTDSSDCIKVWNLRTVVCIQSICPPQISLATALHSNGAMIATASGNGVVQLWSLDRGECLANFSGRTKRFLAASFDRHDQQILAGRDDGLILSWSLDQLVATPSIQYVGHQDIIRSIAISPSNKYMASASHDATVRLWDRHTGKCLDIMTVHSNWSSRVFFLDEQTIVSSGEDGKICYWELETKKVTILPTDSQYWLMGLGVSPDGNIIAAGYSSSVIGLWDRKTMHHRTLTSQGSRIRSIAFSPDQQHLVTMSDDSILSVCDYQQLTCEKSWSVNGRDWLTLSFLPNDHHRVAIGGRPGIEIWDINTGQCLQKILGHTAPVCSISFTATGEYLLSSSEDGTVKVWNFAQGEVIQTVASNNN